MTDRKALESIDLGELYETAPVGLCVFDTEIRYVRINQRLAAINCKPASDHAGRSIEEMAPEVAHTVVPVIKKVLESGEPVFNWEVIKRSNTGNSETAQVFLCTYHPLRTVEGKMLGISSVVQDVTSERRRAEALLGESYAELESRVEERTQELKKSETRFKALLESTLDGVVVWDESGAIVIVNPQTEQLFGYRRDELVGTSIERLFPGVEWEQHVQGWTADRLKPNTRPLGLRLDLSAAKKDGTVFQVELSLSSSVVGGEKFVLAIVRDVTELRTAFGESSRLAAIVEASTDAIISSGPNGTIESWNHGAEQMFGYSEEEAVGMPFARLIPPEREYEATETREGILRGIPTTIPETVRMKKDGERITVSIVAYSVENVDGKVIAIVAVARDLSSEMKTRLQLAAIVEASTNGIIRVTPEGTVQSWNKGAEKIFGYSEEEAIGMAISLLVPPDRISETSQTPNVFEHGDTLSFPDTVRLRRDGTTVQVSVSVYPIRDGQGNIVAGGLSARDIGEQKQLEQQFQHAERLAAIGKLAGGVAHDFNNILTVIRGISELLQDDLSPESESRENLDAILTAADRGSTLTRQLLAFSRKQRHEDRISDVNVLLSDLRSVLERTILESIDLDFDLQSQWSVRIDPAQFEQVVLNLATNARDAMPLGGALTIRTSDVTYDNERTFDDGRNKFLPVNITPGAYVQLTATDTGAGMDRNTMTHIFEPFYTTKERGKGTGLGLAAAYGIVKQTGGWIGVESEVGKGSRFYVLLPKVEGKPEATEVVSEEIKIAGKGTILVVEDDAAVLKLVSSMLKRRGYTVLDTLTPQKALDEYLDISVDLILTDVIMPSMSGPDFVKRWQQRRPNTQVLFMSGHIDDSLEHHDIPERDLITKPFSSEELLRRVADAVAR